jgi:hypothetical protein
MREGILMSRNRSAARTIARVELLEGRQLMAQTAFIHLGALTGKALVDFNHGLTPASDGWREVASFGFGVGAGGKASSSGKVDVSSFNILTRPPFLRLTSNEHFAKAEVVFRGGNHRLLEELDFKSVSVQSDDRIISGDAPEQSVSFGFGQVTRKFLG